MQNVLPPCNASEFSFSFLLNYLMLKGSGCELRVADDDDDVDCDADVVALIHTYIYIGYPSC